MKELKCPKCGSVFTVDEADYASIVNQVKNAEFDAEIARRMKELDSRHKAEQELASTKAEQDFQQKMTRKDAAEFSFFLAIPVMLGASLLKVLKFFMDGGVMGATEIVYLLVGMVVAFVVSIVVIKFLMAFIKKHDFKVFGIYRIILGIAVLVYFAVN